MPVMASSEESMGKSCLRLHFCQWPRLEGADHFFHGGRQAFHLGKTVGMEIGVGDAATEDGRAEGDDALVFRQFIQSVR